MKNKLSDFESKIQITFINKQLLEQVFVHRSYLNEHKNFSLDHNERLEFLGDAVLELIVTEYLYNSYPNPEGELTNWRSALVKGESLSKLANDTEMEKYLMLSCGEQKSTGKARQLILANTFEALIGAIYLDQGYDTVKQFILKILVKKLPRIIDNQLYIDAKSKLQELTQEKLSITPSYNVISETGPDHDKEFIMTVCLNDRKIGQGNGSSKQEAEQHAAQNALESTNQF